MRRLPLACVSLSLAFQWIMIGNMCLGQAADKRAETPPPVFIFDDGWFEEQGYRCWDVKARWQAVPDDLKRHAWLTLYLPGILGTQTDYGKIANDECCAFTDNRFVPPESSPVEGEAVGTRHGRRAQRPRSCWA